MSNPRSIRDGAMREHKFLELFHFSSILASATLRTGRFVDARTVQRPIAPMEAGIEAGDRWLRHSRAIRASRTAEAVEGVDGSRGGRIGGSGDPPAEAT